MLDRRPYELEVEDDFQAAELNPQLWIPYYLPHWSSRAASAPRYEVGEGSLRLRIDADQQPWAPEWDGHLRVSSLQTGLFAGPVGSSVGQLHFRPDLVVREAQEPLALYTPQYGLFEARVAGLDDPANMVALWMIGLEDRPERSAEILVFEIFGRDVDRDAARIGMGLRPFGDPSIRDAFEQVTVAVDVRQLHWYAVEWLPDRVSFYVDEQLVKVVRQSPAYPMQFMLDVYEFADSPGPVSPLDRYPKVFTVDCFRGWRPITGPAARASAFTPESHPVEGG